MTNAPEMAPQTWVCPEHETEYGDGIPDPRGRAFTWSCPDCEREAYEAERTLRHRHQRYDWWRRHSGIPARYRAATVASIQPLSASAKALASAVTAYTADLRQRHNAGDGLLLLGPPGLAKTLTLAAIINQACRIYRGPIYAVWPDVLAELKAGFGGPRDDPRRQAAECLRDAPFLALDEVAGVRDATDFDHSELFGLVDYRYRHELPTLVAANATPANFASMVGERIADRLLETGPQLVLTGASQRGKVAIHGADALDQPPASITVRMHRRGDWRDKTIDAPDGRLAG